MDNTYAFVVFNDTQIYERRLDYWLPGYLINPQSITIISNIVQNGRRTAKFWLPHDAKGLYNINNNYTTFPTQIGESIGQFIMARGHFSQTYDTEFDRFLGHSYEGKYQYNNNDGFTFEAVIYTDSPSEQPSYSPVTYNPTISPISDNMCIEGDLDIIFLVDN